MWFLPFSDAECGQCRRKKHNAEYILAVDFEIYVGKSFRVIKRIGDFVVYKIALTKDDKHFMDLCKDMGFWFDEVLGNEELLAKYYELGGV